MKRVLIKENNNQFFWAEYGLKNNLIYKLILGLLFFCFSFNYILIQLLPDSLNRVNWLLVVNSIVFLLSFELFPILTRNKNKEITQEKQHFNESKESLQFILNEFNKVISFNDLLNSIQMIFAHVLNIKKISFMVRSDFFVNSFENEYFILKKERSEWKKSEIIQLDSLFKEIKNDFSNLIHTNSVQDNQTFKDLNIEFISKLNFNHDEFGIICFHFDESFHQSDKVFQNIYPELLKLISSTLVRVKHYTDLVRSKEEILKKVSLMKLINEYNHEIKSPLGVMESYAKETFITEEELRDVVLRQSSRASRLVQTMLNITKERHEKKLENTQIELVIEKSLSLLPPRIGKIFKSFRQTPIIQADVEDLTIMFINLFKNSLEAIHKETLYNKIKIKTMTDRIKNRVIVKIIDSGVGIPDEVLEKLWDIKNSQKKDGSGIGLSVVKRIVEDHSGEVQVKSKVGKGAVFIISLPIVMN